MSEFALLLIYSLLIILVSLMGGWLPTVARLTHTRLQLVMSFVAGLMLGIAFYHLLPHAIFTLGGLQAVDHAVWWLMLGLLLMFMLLRAFHFHQHDVVEVDTPHSHLPHSHGHDHDHAVVPARAHPFSWAGLVLGLGLHTVIDGVALGAAVKAEGNEALLAGLAVFLAIALHKPLDAMSITALMQASGRSKGERWLVNGVFSVLCPLGALLFFWGVEHYVQDTALWVGSALAFSAGVFICISLSDLLPEIQFHSHDQSKLTAALLLGIVLAYGIGLIEPDHSQHAHHFDHKQHEEH